MVASLMTATFLTNLVISLMVKDWSAFLKVAGKNVELVATFVMLHTVANDWFLHHSTT